MAALSIHRPKLTPEEEQKLTETQAMAWLWPATRNSALPGTGVSRAGLILTKFEDICFQMDGKSVWRRAVYA